MPRPLLPAIGFAAAGLAAICAWQVWLPESLEIPLARSAPTSFKAATHQPTALAALAPLPTASHPASLFSPLSPGPIPAHTAPPLAPSAPAPERHFRGGDESLVTTPVQFDAMKPAARRFEIYPRLVAAPAFGRLPAPAPGVVLDLAPGTREPIAVLDEHAPGTPAQTAALGAIADDFLDRIESTAGSTNDDEVTTEWDQAQADADSAYRNIFGEAAYHQRLTDAAVRALGRPVSAP